MFLVVGWENSAIFVDETINLKLDMKHLLFVAAALAVLLMGCNKPVPAGKLVHFHYSDIVFSYTLDPSNDSASAVLEFEEFISMSDTTITVPRAVLDSVAAIAVRHNMQNYKSKYQPNNGITDKGLWLLVMAYDSGDSIVSHGDNARPDDDGITEITKYFHSLLRASK